MGYPTSIAETLADGTVHVLSLGFAIPASILLMIHAAGQEGQLTATIQATVAELQQLPGLLELLEDCAGRILFNGMPTGVEVGEAMHPGGLVPHDCFPWGRRVIARV